MSTTTRPPSPAVRTATELPTEAARPASGVPRAAADTSPGGSSTAMQPITKRRPAWVRDALQLARRAHLYAGLLLVPWVFLYGFTGFLFNHPSWFTSQLHLNFGPRELAGTPLERLAPPRELASDVVRQLNTRFGTAYQLVDPDRAALGRGGLNASLELPDQAAYQLTLHAEGQGGTIRPARRGPGAAPSARRGAEAGRGPGSGRPPGPGRGENSDRGAGGPATNRGMGGPVGDSEEQAPFHVAAGLLLEDSPIEQLRASLPALLERLELPEAQVNAVQMMPLTFRMRDAQQTWEVHYSADSGAVSGHPVDDTAAAATLSPRTFLTNLHKAHGYPAGETNARSFWAVIVDIMSTVMILWGVTGLVMWWQIKRTRLPGGICLALSVAGALWLGLSMHANMLPQ